MKNAEIRQLSDAELNSTIVEQQDALQRLKFSHAVSDIENPSSIGELKKRIARLKTEQSARRLAKSN